jgi:glycosyltransferase involved in cell wall biosynthesis
LSEIKTICILSDWMHGLPDEGIHNLAQNLLERWGTSYNVRAVRIGADFSINRLFLGRRLRGALREIGPDLIVYISSSSAKVAALFRARMLKIYSPRSKVFVIATQPVHHGFFGRRLAALLAPDGIFVQSPGSAEALRHVPCPVYFLPSGVDTSRFVPVDEARKKDLRRKHAVDVDAFVLLHVGHINRGRNVQILEAVARVGDMQVILVGSTSTPHDEDLARELNQAGVRLIREYVPRIEEIYQLADAYIFPVVSEDAAIGVPLSVLEAMACNLPVVTTPFGGLPGMFPMGKGLVYFDSENGLPALIDAARRLEKISTRRMVEPYGWKSVASGAMEMMQSRKSLR